MEVEQRNNKSKIYIILSVVLTIAIICMTFLYFRTKNQLNYYKKNPYEPVTIEQDATNLQQRVLKSTDLLVISLNAISDKNEVTYCINIYDTSNNIIAKIERKLDNYPLGYYDMPYFYSITIKRNDYPAAVNAKIISYKQTLYKKSE